MAQDVVMKGVCSPLYKALNQRLLDHHVFLGVVGLYDFVLVRRITGFPTILALTHYN